MRAWACANSPSSTGSSARYSSPRSIRSRISPTSRAYRRRTRLRRERGDEAAEVVAARLEVRVLVVARTRRAEQHDLARPCLVRRVLDGPAHGLVIMERQPAERRGELGRGGADEVDRDDVRPDRLR